MHTTSVMIFATIGAGVLTSALPSTSRMPKDLWERSYHQQHDDNHTQIFCHNQTDPAIETYGDQDIGGPGVVIVNYNNNTAGSMYFLYESNQDEVPYKFTTIPPWSHVYITVCPTFEGRIVRGDRSNLDYQPRLLGTWAEMNWHPDGSAWGDISLLEGNDGAAVIQSLDGINKMKGFAVDLITEAPPEAMAQKLSGAMCLDKVVGLAANNFTKSYEMKYLDPWNVYLDNDVNPVIGTANGRFQVTFYQGVI